MQSCQNECELISKVFVSQLRRPGRKDWAGLVQNDMNEVGIHLSHDQIKGMKKEAFKALVKKKVTECGFKYLLNIKMSHSKVKNIEYSKFEMAPYLYDKRFSIYEKTTLVKLRSSMSDCLGNFKSRVVSTSCPCDLSTLQTQEHLLTCVIIRDNCVKVRQNNDVVYNDLFLSVDRQLPAVRLFADILETMSRVMPNFV